MNRNCCGQNQNCVLVCQPNCYVPCIDYCGLKVEKTLLSVCRVPLAAFVEALVEGAALPPFIPFSQLMMTYEITLTNTGDKEITNLSIVDTLASLIFSEAGGQAVPFNSSVEVIKAPSTIVPLSSGEIAARNGQLLDSANSSLPPCHVAKILLRLNISAPAGSVAEIRYVQNTIYVDGILCGSGKIRTIVEKSKVWKTESDIHILVGLLFPIP